VLFTEIITLRCENRAKCTNTVGGKSGILNVTKKGSAFSNHCFEWMVMKHAYSLV